MPTRFKLGPLMMTGRHSLIGKFGHKLNPDQTYFFYGYVFVF
jgi:hypothetical protein